MSIRVDREEAKQQFSELLLQVSKGEEIEIVSDGKEIVRLVPSPLIQRNIVVHSHLAQSHLRKLAEAIMIMSRSDKSQFSTSLTSSTANRLSSDENFEPLENQSELDEIMENISLIQSRMKEDRLEIDASSSNIDNMLTLLED